MEKPIEDPLSDIKQELIEVWIPHKDLKVMQKAMEAAQAAGEAPESAPITDEVIAELGGRDTSASEAGIGDSEIAKAIVTLSNSMNGIGLTYAVARAVYMKALLGYLNKPKVGGVKRIWPTKAVKVIKEEEEQLHLSGFQIGKTVTNPKGYPLDVKFSSSSHSGYRATLELIQNLVRNGTPELRKEFTEMAASFLDEKGVATKDELSRFDDMV